MKKTLATVIILLAAVSFTPSQTKRNSVEQKIVQLEREWADAYVKRNRAPLDRILADDFMETDDNGGTDNKTEYMDLAMNPVGTLSPFEFNDVKMRVYGNAAISTGRIHERGKSESFSYTNVYVKQQGRWRAVASHLSRVAQ